MTTRRLLVALWGCVIIACSTGCAIGPAPIDPPTAQFVEEAEDHELGYAFSAGEVDDRPALEVTLRLQTGDATHTDLEIPRQWMDVRRYAGITDLQVVEGEAELVEMERDDRVRLKHSPHTSVTVGYRVIPTYEELSADEQRVPVIDEGRIIASGHGLFVAPHSDELLLRDILLDWSALPESWEVGNGHSVGDRKQSLSTSINALRSRLYLAGHFEVLSEETAAFPIHVAYPDELKQSSDEITAKAVSLIEYAHRQFGGAQHDFVLVAVYPVEHDYPGAHGVAYPNSVGVWFTEGVPIGHPRILSTVAHEIVHLWNGQTLRPADPRARLAWFHEGFTDYYASRLLIRTGMIDLEEYVDLRNRQLLSLETSPVRDAPNAAIEESFWTDQHLFDLPYLRGAILGMTWDAGIRRETNFERSLDDVMRELFERARTEETELTRQQLEEVLEFVWEPRVEDLESIVDRGEEIVPDHRALGPCVEPSITIAGRLDFGFDIESETFAETGQFEGVDPDGPAYEAGLRNGYYLNESVDYSAEVGDIAVEKLEFQVVTEDGTELEISYLPTSEPRRIRQFAIDEELYERDPDECMAWFQY